MKQAKETAAQKSSHQNMRFWTRRARRTTVIKPETMKKDKEASGARVSMRATGDEIGRQTLEVNQGRGHHVGGTDGTGWDGGVRWGAAWVLYFSPRMGQEACRVSTIQ